MIMKVLKEKNGWCLELIYLLTGISGKKQKAQITHSLVIIQSVTSMLPCRDIFPSFDIFTVKYCPFGINLILVTFLEHGNLACYKCQGENKPLPLLTDITQIRLILTHIR